MKKYSALLMASVTGCSNMMYTTPDLHLEEAREKLQTEIYSSLFNDTDNDGVIDYWDQCVNTPLNVKVSNHGCPLDKNGNGIPDYQENLFGAVSESIVSEEIFEIESEQEVIVEQDKDCYVSDQFSFVSRCYGFAYDSDRVTENMAQEIDQLISIFQDDQEIVALEITGHTDDKGNSQYNLDLSKRRAAAIANYIKSHLRQEVEFLVSGMGEFDPLASNASAEGRALNRRVEIHALYKQKN